MPQDTPYTESVSETRDPEGMTAPKLLRPNRFLPLVKKPIRLPAVAVLFIALVSGYIGLAAGTTIIGSRKPAPDSPTPTGSKTASAPVPDPSWSVHTIPELGIRFSLPPALGLLDASGRETPGETGMQYCAVFVGSLSDLTGTVYAGGGSCGGGVISMGSVTRDYEAGREGGFGDLTGYEKREGKFFPKFLKTFHHDPLPAGIVSEFINAYDMTILKIRGVTVMSDQGDRPLLGTPGEGMLGALVNHPRGNYAGFNIQMKNTTPGDEAVFDTILNSLTPLPQSIIDSSPQSSAYSAPSSWKRTTVLDSLALCLPPKWLWRSSDSSILYVRDAGYQPSVTSVQAIPYTGGSRREAYFAYWQQEYPDVRDLLRVSETQLGSSTVLVFTPVQEPKTSPEGLTVVWYAAGKLWKASVQNWNMITDSQSAFFDDFYRMINCSIN